MAVSVRNGSDLELEGRRRGVLLDYSYLRRRAWAHGVLEFAGREAAAARWGITRGRRGVVGGGQLGASRVGTSRMWERGKPASESGKRARR